MEVESCRRVRDAIGDRLRHVLVGEHGHVAELHQLVGRVLFEEVGEEDGAVRQWLPRRTQEVLATDLQRERLLGEPLGEAELQLLDADAQNIRIALCSGLAVDLERAVTVARDLGDRQTLAGRAVGVVPEGSEGRLGLDHRQEESIGSHLAIHVQLGGLLRRVLFGRRGTAANQDHALVLGERAHQKLLLLIAVAIVDHDSDVTAQVEILSAGTELFTGLLHRLRPSTHRVLRDGLAEADAHLEVSFERPYDDITRVHAFAVDLSGRGGTQQPSLAAESLTHGRVEGALVALPTGEERDELGVGRAELVQELVCRSLGVGSAGACRLESNRCHVPRSVG